MTCFYPQARHTFHRLTINSKDLGRPALEAYSFEITVLIERAVLSATKLPEWSKSVVKKDLFDSNQQAWNPKVFYEPKGVALVIAYVLIHELFIACSILISIHSPWNFPMILSLQPMMAAISAGCCCAVKVSEIAPHYATLIADLVPKYLDTSAFQIITGAVAETTRALELKCKPR